ncbi:MAG: right-handed parallel beta-helix repeat-containing protein [Bacteroidales bacterium]|nr:right-handed parallel beta-helix repeat-containing protein [Bacteroidales bacterium]
MKKIFLLFFIIFPVILFAEDGSGTSTYPYYGTISSSVEWDPDDYTSGEIYVGTSSNNDLTIGNGGHLTILSGATIIFTETTTDLIITGTGRITANAVSTNQITFTKATGNDNWGHMIFDGISGSNTSLFDNCIIEYGKKPGTTEAYENAGGGICVNSSYVTIENTTIRNNYALFGGGVFVAYGQNPTIKNCFFEDNTSREAGGGIYVYNNSSVEIVNCIFDGNYADGVSATYYGGGGVQFGINTSNAKVINSIFVNNTADREGNGMYFYSSGQVINCIFWGSSGQLYFRSSSLGSSTNCAIQNFTSSSHYTNCFNLNSSNSASDGPNFNATDGTDWSIKFISPCRDTGTDTGAPITDYDGESRIGTTDIGAYEVQYSRWDGSSSTAWSTDANWEQDINPGSSSSDVLIPSGLSTNYPTSTGTSFTISSGYNMIIEPGAQATFATLTNSSGTLKLESDASGIASLLFNTYSDSGTEDIEMFLAGGGDPNYKWHYIAVPDDDISTDVFTDVGTDNLLLFDDSKISTNNMEGWQWYDGYDNTTSFSQLNTKIGYNFYHSSDVTVQLPTTTDLLSSMGSSVSLQYNGNGLNLIGNSLTCSIDWDEVTFTGNMRNAIYFTKNNSLVAYNNGVGSPDGTTGIIPPLHGFFVKALETNCSIDFSGTDVNVHGTVNRYKSEIIIPLIRLELLLNSETKDETVVRFNENATETFDNEYDASKLFSESLNKPQLYTYIGDEKYIINAVPFPETVISIPMTFKATSEGSYSIRRTQLVGLDNYLVELVDTYENFTTNLQTTQDYYFSSAEGTFDDRFILTIKGTATGLDEIIKSDRLFNIYTYSNHINIQTMTDDWSGSRADINVFDLTGRTIMKLSGVELFNGETKQFSFVQAKGIYIVEINNGIRRVVQKISHR